MCSSDLPSFDFVGAQVQTQLKAAQRSNPFSTASGREGGSSLGFEFAARVAEAVGQGYGPFQNHECREIKDILVSMDRTGTGRVRLPDFYRK